MEGAWGEQGEEEQEDDDRDKNTNGNDGKSGNKDDDGKNNGNGNGQDDDGTTDGSVVGATNGNDIGDDQGAEVKNSGGTGSGPGDDAEIGLDDAPKIPPPPVVAISRVSSGTRGGTNVVETESSADDTTTTESEDPGNFEDTKDGITAGTGDDKYYEDEREDKYYEDEREDDYDPDDEEEEDTSFISSKGTYFEPNLPQMDPTYRLPNGDIDLDLQSEEISPPVLLGVLSILAVAICLFRKPRKFAKGKKPNKISYPISGVKREVPVY